MASENSDDRRSGPPIRLRLNTLTNARRSLARVTRLYGAGELSAAEARTLAYLHTQLLGYFRLERDIEIERRIEEIERRLESGR